VSTVAAFNRRNTISRADGTQKRRMIKWAELVAQNLSLIGQIRKGLNNIFLYIYIYFLVKFLIHLSINISKCRYKYVKKNVYLYSVLFWMDQ